ncbi:histone deacetylase family protein [Phytohalomonas tamaricis]|uniref:histone deacetylase family protein n=1 Tax=Phytohalomonas tamaricis TaxID=2081032 RepID=UPI000D0AD3B5|nr:histone deacetylase family protein [Phytohalomonas tamaricis]
MITSYITHPDCTRHYMGPWHPESPQRLEAIRARLALSGVLQHTMQYDAQIASEEQILRVHPHSHILMLHNQLGEGTANSEDLVCVGDDTFMNKTSLEVARVAAGAVIRGVDQLFRQQADNVFCAVRPPGHHAERAQAMGFCFYNNVAIAVAHAKAVYGVKRVAILDFDVHQANGTVDIFKNDPDVLLCSSFQANFYPWRYLQSHWDHIVNTPLAQGAGSREFRHAVEHFWLPALQQHRPEVVFISAGFDAHREDPMGELNLDEDDYFWATQLAIDIARTYSQGRLLSVLEGGYQLEALGRSVEAHLKGLIGLH